jgi:ubiquinone biosynthesis protein COQ9
MVKARDAAPGLASVREAMLPELLRHVVFDGWSERTLQAAARTLAIDAATLRRAYPCGVTDAATQFSAWADAEMLAALADTPPDLRTHQRVAFAIRARLTALAPYREAVRRLAAWSALPGHQLVALRAVARTVDAVWRGTGDRSVDFGWYTKRASLAAVYGATVLYWLEDRSAGSADTWDFLDRRLADLGRVPKFRARAAKVAERMPKPFHAARTFR